jgi:putative oxygen-independent coproporphyrinogen III oxidase
VTAADAFGVYVHWPFCAAKCPYCDFNSHVRTHIEEDAWTDATVRELSFVAQLAGSSRRPATSIFFGGGTPSLMSGHAVGHVLNAIAHHWGIAPGAEITLEANPASVDAGRFRDYRAAGINRLSLGVQSLDAQSLRFLGRLHSVEEAIAAVRLAASLFERVSIDLIYARPAQTVEDWRAELGRALAFELTHFSLYQLTIEDGTPFATLARAGELKTPGDDASADLYEATQEMMDRAGMPAYEISNHAKPGEECRHNLLYWRYGDYAGVGPGAHGRLTRDGARLATMAEKLPERWRERVMRDGHGLAEMARVEPDDAAREHLLMNLRLAEGLDLDAYRARWGRGVDAGRIAALADDDLVALTGSQLAVTRKGRLVLNAITAALAH